MIIINVTGTGRTINELKSIESCVDKAIDKGVNSTASTGEKLGKGILSNHIFTSNAFTSWRWQDTGRHSAIVTYMNSGIPHPTGERSSLYFMALEYGRRGYRGSPNKIARGGSGDYSYPHHKVGSAGGIYMVTQTAQSLRAIFPEVMSSYVGACL